MLALVLLVLRLVLPGSPMPTPMPAAIQAGSLARDAGAGLPDGAPICHAEAGSGRKSPEPGSKPAVPPSVPMHDCALCPVCQLAAAVALPSVAAWPAPLLQTGAAQPPLPPPSTGPPQRGRSAVRSRGPPAFSA